MNKRLFVAGLPFTTTQDELRNLFAEAGTVVSVIIIDDKNTGRSKGFGFVEMETYEEAEAAVKQFHDIDFGGRKLIVTQAKPQEERRSVSRGGGCGGRNKFRGGDNFGRREGGRGSFGRTGRVGHRPGRGRFSR